jgi:hypothetical protein
MSGFWQRRIAAKKAAQAAFQPQVDSVQQVRRRLKLHGVEAYLYPVTEGHTRGHSSLGYPMFRHKKRLVPPAMRWR